MIQTYPATVQGAARRKAHAEEFNRRPSDGFYDSDSQLSGTVERIISDE